MERAPQTLMSPNGAAPSRGPWFFVAMVALLLLAIAAGAAVVLFVVARRDAVAAQDAGAREAAAPVVSAAPPASAPPTSTTAPTTTIAGADPTSVRPGVFAPRPRATASGAATPPATAPATAAVTTTTVASAPPSGASAAECLCRAPNAKNMVGDLLCPPTMLKTPQCYCKAVDNVSLCHQPAEHCDGDNALYSNPKAKEGDPCTGFPTNADPAQPGTLQVCNLCKSTASYGGKHGAPCAGVRATDQASVTGSIDCSNLEYMCNRMRDPKACAAWQAHQ